MKRNDKIALGVMFISVMTLMGFILVVGTVTNPLTVSGYTQATQYDVNANPSLPSVWTDYLGNSGTITLVYDGSNHFYAQVLYNKFGTVTPSYTLEFQNATGWFSLNAYRTAISNGFRWSYLLDWSAWIAIRISSTSQSSGMPQSPLPF
jgi:hypothetical protein